MDSISGNLLSGQNSIANQHLEMKLLGGIKEAAGNQAANDATKVGETFGQMLSNQMNEINQLQANANQAVETFATGGDIELHNVMTAVDKAQMSLEVAVQIRNRMLNAYQEISRMSI